jgi:hypothetical protein
VHDLAARGLVALDDGCDGGIVDVEHLAEEEHGALHRTEALEHGEESERERLVALDAVGRVVVVIRERLGEPRAGVDLAVATR